MFISSICLYARHKRIRPKIECSNWLRKIVKHPNLTISCLLSLLVHWSSIYTVSWIIASDGEMNRGGWSGFESLVNPETVTTFNLTWINVIWIMAMVSKKRDTVLHLWYLLLKYYNIRYCTFRTLFTLAFFISYFILVAMCITLWIEWCRVTKRNRVLFRHKQSVRLERFFNEKKVNLLIPF